MTIVQEFIERNEQLLDRVAEENPNLGGALAEALAVIDFFAKSNNVTFDENQKEAILTSEPIAEEILKKVEEVPIQQEKEILYVVDTTDEDLANRLEKYNNNNNNPSANVFANGRYYVFTEKPQVVEKSASSPPFFLKVRPLINTQARLTRAELNALLEEKPTLEETTIMPTPPQIEETPSVEETPLVEETPIVHALEEFVEDDIMVSQDDLDALKQIEDLDDLGDINLDDLGDLDDLSDLDDLGDLDDLDDLDNI